MTRGKHEWYGYGIWKKRYIWLNIVGCLEDYKSWPCGRKLLLSGPWRAHRSSWSCRARTDGWRPMHDTSQGNPRCDLWPHATLCETPQNAKSAEFLILNQLIETDCTELNECFVSMLFFMVCLASKCPCVNATPFHLFQFCQLYKECDNYLPLGSI